MCWNYLMLNFSTVNVVPYVWMIYIRKLGWHYYLIICRVFFLFNDIFFFSREMSLFICVCVCVCVEEQNFLSDPHLVSSVKGTAVQMLAILCYPNWITRGSFCYHCDLQMVKSHYLVVQVNFFQLGKCAICSSPLLRWPPGKQTLRRWISLPCSQKYAVIWQLSCVVPSWVIYLKYVF